MDGELSRPPSVHPLPDRQEKVGDEMLRRQADGRAYIFDHVWRQLKEKLYVVDLQGVDWDPTSSSPSRASRFQVARSNNRAEIVVGRNGLQRAAAPKAGVN